MRHVGVGWSRGDDVEQNFVSEEMAAQKIHEFVKAMEHNAWCPEIKTPPKQECQAFHPYNSNPLLCHCGKTAQEHAWLVAQQSLKRKLKVIEQEKAYEQKRERLMELAGVEIDPPEEEMVEVAPGYKMPRKQFEQLREMILNKERVEVKVSIPVASTVSIPDWKDIEWNLPPRISHKAAP